MVGWTILGYVFTAVLIALTIGYTFFDLPGRLSGKHKPPSEDRHE